jgi:TIR domain
MQRPRGSSDISLVAFGGSEPRAGSVTEWPTSHQVSQVSASRSSAAGSPRGVSGLPDDVRPEAPLFFLSHANPAWRGIDGQYRPNRRTSKFFDDLSENVAELVSRPVGSEPGFMDRSIASGTNWPDELLAAVGRCQVFVALLSDPYVASSWCSKEWYAFSRRTVYRRAREGRTDETGIIPVIWTPAPDNRLPAVVSKVQRFSPRGLPEADVAARYNADGVYGLMRTGQDMLYDVVVWRLAQRIAEFHFGHEVEERILCQDELRDFFREDPR